MELQYTLDAAIFAVLALLFVLYVRKKGYPVAQVIVGVAAGQCIGSIAVMVLFWFREAWYATALAVPLVIASLWMIPKLSRFATFPSTHVLPWAVFFSMPLVPLAPGALFAAFGGHNFFTYALLGCSAFLGYSMLLSACTIFLVLWVRRHQPSVSAIFTGFTSGLIAFVLFDLLIYFDKAGDFHHNSPIGHLVRLFVSMTLCLWVCCTPAKLLRAILRDFGAGQP